MVDRLVAVSDADYRLPEPVLQAIGADIANDETVLGQQVQAAILSSGIASEALGQFELKQADGTGHSWVSDGTFFPRIANRIGATPYTKRAVSGRSVGDIANLTLGGALAWVPRTRALSMAICTINDITIFDGSAASRRHYNHAWRSILSMITANGLIAGNTGQFVYSAGWSKTAVVGTSGSTAGNTKNSTGGELWQTTTVGSYFEFTFTGTQVDVFLIARIAGAGLVTFTEGGTSLGSLDLTPTMGQDVPAVFKIRGLTSGDHTIRGTLDSGASLTVDSYRIPSTAPVPILVLGEPEIIPAGTDHSTYLADMEAFKGDLATIVAEYPSAHYVDLNQAGWDKATMLMVDGKHPNDKGAAFIAGLSIAALSTFPYSLGLNVMGVGYPTSYAAPAGPAVPSGGQAGGAAVPTITDDFERPGPGLGSTVTGAKTWSAFVGSSVGIADGHMKALAGTYGFSYVSTGSGDGAIDYKIDVLGTPATAVGGVMFRGVDAANLFMAGFAGGVYKIQKRVAGTFTTIQTSAQAPLATDVCRLELSGTTAVLKVNGVTVVTATVTENPTADKHGGYFHFGTDPVSAMDYWRWTPAA